METRDQTNGVPRNVPPNSWHEADRDKMGGAGPGGARAPLQTGPLEGPAMREATQHRRFGNVRELPSGRFQARWRGPDGHHHKAPETFATKDDANAWLARQQVEQADGLWIDPRVSAQPLGPVIDVWTERRKKGGYRPSTWTRDVGYVERYISPRWAAVGLDKIEPDDIQDWYLELGATLAPATVGKVAQIFHNILEQAVRSKRINYNPAKGVRAPRDPDPTPMMFLEPEQIVTLADAIAHPVDDDGEPKTPTPQWAGFVLVGAYCGLRAGELLALRACDVDTERRRLHVSRSVVEVAGKRHVGQTKTKAGRRIVPYPRAVKAAITERLAVCEHPEDLLFPNTLGDYQGLSSFRSRTWRPATERAGVAGLRIHDLRHTAVSLWIAAGHEPKQIAAWAGHRSIVTVYDRYGHLLEHDDDDPMGKLDALLTRRRPKTGTVVPIR